ncbi:MAG: hypothetical protein PWR32_164 [Candidatus Woesearchaeota archaeon]|nr:hypothetical protein [Candidatus Woesearchaeota archaeon]
MKGISIKIKHSYKNVLINKNNNNFKTNVTKLKLYKKRALENITKIKMINKKANFSKKLFEIIKAFFAFLITGFILDTIFSTISSEGTFKQVINILRWVSPGFSDFAKILLDLFYAVLFVFLKDR